MAWNYRVLKRQRNKDVVTFEICEVYYDDNDTPHSWIENKNVLQQESIEDLEDTLRLVHEAMKKPVLEIVGNGFGLQEAIPHRINKY